MTLALIKAAVGSGRSRDLKGPGVNVPARRHSRAATWIVWPRHCGRHDNPTGKELCIAWFHPKNLQQRQKSPTLWVVAVKSHIQTKGISATTAVEIVKDKAETRGRGVWMVREQSWRGIARAHIQRLLRQRPEK